MLVIAVRSFGIIGAGAVLFAGTAITGIETLAAVGEVSQIILLINYEKKFRTWHSNTGSRRWSNLLHYACKLFTSVLCREVRPMLSSWSWSEGKDCLPKIVLIGPSFSPSLSHGHSCL